MKKTFDLYQTAQVLLASTSFCLACLLMLIHGNSTILVPRLNIQSSLTFYIGKGAEWQNIQFSVTTQLKMTQQYSSNMTISSL